MALAGAINGDLFILTKGGIEVAHTTDATLTLDQNLIDSTTKSSNRNETHVRGNRSYTLSASGIIFFGASEGFYELATGILAGTSATFRISPYTDYTDASGSASSGDYYYQGTFDISSLTLETANNEVASYSMDAKVTGSLAIAANA